MTADAVLGTGRMGSAMAERLAGQGVAVVVYNRTPDRATALAERIGASVATTPAEAASRADVVITMVADDAAVHDLFDGPDGIAAGIRPGSVAVDMSTVLPDTIRCDRAGRPGARRRDPRRAGLGQRHLGHLPAS